MIPLFGEPTADRKRDLLEGLLIMMALQTLQLRTNVVLDFGLWGRDETVGTALAVHIGRGLLPGDPSALSTSTSNAPGSHTARQPHRTRRSL